jgi:hypothetical protein
MKWAAYALPALLLIVTLGLVVVEKRESGASPVSFRETRSTRVPLSAGFRPPVEIDPIALGIRAETASPSFARQIDALRESGDLRGVNRVLPAWFQADPEAVRQWLAKQNDLATFEPALAAIASHLSTSGNSALALQWVDLLDDPSLREDTLCKILALGRRQGAVNDDTLFATGLPPHRLEGILSGAEGD